MKYLILIFFITSTILVSCASREEKLAQAKEIVNVISDSLKNVKGESIYIADEDKRTRFTYYIIDNEIKYINEELFIPTGHFVNFYYFDNSKLIHLDSRSLSYIPEESGLVKKPAEKRIYLDGSEVLDSDIIVKGERTELQESEIKELIAYADKLFNLSLDHLQKHDH